MSDPKIKPTLYNVTMECMSVTSSLHCPPDPIELDNPNEEGLFLDELDHWAKHASEHASAAVRSAAVIEQEMQDYYDWLLRVRWFKQQETVPIEEVMDKLRTWLGRN